jgi:hypothetical protein
MGSELRFQRQVTDRQGNPTEGGITMSTTKEEALGQIELDRGQDLILHLLGALRSRELQDEIQFLVRDIVRAIHDEKIRIEVEEDNRAEEMDEVYRKNMESAQPFPGWEERLAARQAEADANRFAPISFASLKKKQGGAQP